MLTPVAVFGALETEKTAMVIGNKELKNKDNNLSGKELLAAILMPDGKIQDIDGHYTILNSVYGFNKFNIEKHLSEKQKK